MDELIAMEESSVAHLQPLKWVGYVIWVKTW